MGENKVKQYTYTLYDNNWNKCKTIVCTDKDPIGKAIETFLRGSQVPQKIDEIGIVVEKIEDIEE
jgi:hypothetical protein